MGKLGRFAVVLGLALAGWPPEAQAVKLDSG